MSSLESKLVGELIAECELKAEPQETNDPFIRMFAVALGSTVFKHPEVGEQVSRVMLLKQRLNPFPASYAFNSLLRLYQMDNLDDPLYPYANPSAWNRGVQTWLEDPMSLDHTMTSMQIWNVGSDVETRISGPKIIAQCWNPKIPEDTEGYKILSVGAARNHGLTMLASDMPIPNIAIDVEHAKKSSSYKKVEATINKLLQQHIALGDCYGVDLYDLRNDIPWLRFLEACRFYPSELLDSEKRDRYRRLNVLRNEIEFIYHTTADFSDIEEPDDFNDWLKGIRTDDKNDMVLFSTSLYQNYPQKRRVMFNNALARLKPDGIVVVLDFIEENDCQNAEHILDSYDFTGPTGKPYTYKLYVYDSNEPDKKLQKCFDFKNGRCEEYIPSQLLLDKLAA